MILVERERRRTRVSLMPMLLLLLLCVRISVAGADIFYDGAGRMFYTEEDALRGRLGGGGQGCESIAEWGCVFVQGGKLGNFVGESFVEPVSCCFGGGAQRPSEKVL